jgi:6,7-dimethyl-8-ribityllumazine synthase
MTDKALPKAIEGQLIAPEGARFAIVASRFNEFIVDRLVEGARDGLVRHGVPDTNITTVRVPGAWEISIVAQRLAKSGRFDAIIACGAVIRGSTAHFDFVAGEAARGVAAASSESGIPVLFGVITTENIEQAIERAGSKAGNKGFEAALGAIEMVSLARKLAEHGL